MRRPAVFAWETFDDLLRKGLKVWLFYLTVLFFFRLFFLGWMQEYMGAGTGAADVLTAVVRGARLSCQTAGALTLVALVPGALAHYLLPRIENVCWKAAAGAELIVLSVLYVASFPYYRQFHTNFSQLMFNAANDDVWALFLSLVQEFYLPVRLAGALLLAYVLWRLFSAFVLAWRGPRLAFAARLALPLRLAVRALALGVCYLVALLSIFGGSLGWQTAVDWENAGVTRDDFLNEAILDSLQAVHRGYVLQHRMLACNGLDFTVDDIRALAALHAGMAPASDDLDDYLHHTAAGPVSERPSHVFLILSESYANWPLLEQYEDLHIADGMRAVIAEEDEHRLRRHGRRDGLCRREPLPHDDARGVRRALSDRRRTAARGAWLRDEFLVRGASDLGTHRRVHARAGLRAFLQPRRLRRRAGERLGLRGRGAL